jgi:hypothetical protein
MKNIPIALLIFYLFLGVGTECVGQDTNKPDLRESCGICKGNARNYSLLNVYFSNAGGDPVPNICNFTEPLFISILYSSNSQNPIHNVRLIADIVKKDRRNPDAAPLSQSYINEFFGTVNPCPDGTCIFSIPLPGDFVPECVNEFYELSQPLVAWTPQNRNNLINSYSCEDYPNAQCLNQPTILIEVGTDLSYSFDGFFDCASEDISQTNVSFVITSLFGGNPTLPYTTEWVFSYLDSTRTSEEFSPFLLNMESGAIINASLIVSQGSLVGEEVSQTISIPLSLSFDDVIEDVEVVNADDGTSNGVIDVTFFDKNLFYFWTSLDEDSFYSENSRIENLSSGTYQLTTINNDTGTCRTDLYDISATVLPVEFIYNRTYFDPKARTSQISWATATEWESSHFEIQRSKMGIHNFEKIAEVKAMGWNDTITEYEFLDDDLPLYGGNILYRLKQVDLNDAFAYSSVMSIRTPEVQAMRGVWRAFPNPTQDGQLRVSLLDRSHYEGEKISFRLVHPMMHSKVISVSSEAEMNEALAQLIPRLSKGVFVIEIRWGQKIEHVKVLKL